MRNYNSRYSNSGTVPVAAGFKKSPIEATWGSAGVGHTFHTLLRIWRSQWYTQIVNLTKSFQHELQNLGKVYKIGF